MSKGLQIVVLLILLPVVLADTTEQSFSSTVTLTIDTGVNTVNILTEGFNNTYTLVNSTNSYSINFRRNITCINSTNVSQITNNYNYYNSNSDNSSDISKSVDRMTSSCQKIADAYGDASSYYKPLLECTSNKAQCERDRDTYKEKGDKVASLESNYNSCLDNKKNVETQFSSCTNELSSIKTAVNTKDSELTQVKSSKNFWLWGFWIAVAVIAGYFYQKKKKEKEHPLEKIMRPQ